MLDGFPQKLFRESHVAFEIAKRHFWLNHPELGKVPRGVAVFGSERGTKSVNVGESKRQRLRLELAGNCQERGLAKEIVGHVLRVEFEALFRFVSQQSAYREHRTRPFAIAGAVMIGLNAGEAAIVEELVDGESGFRTNAEHRAECCRAPADGQSP